MNIFYRTLVVNVNQIRINLHQEKFSSVPEKNREYNQTVLNFF